MSGPSYVQKLLERAHEDGLLTAVTRALLFTRIEILHTYLDQKMSLLDKQGADYMSEDWDTLILLDACRYDYFERENDIEGDLQSRISPGRNSMEFMRETFSERQLYDTVYVTSNPHVERLEGDIFHDVIKTPLTEGWDSKLRTVPPSAVTDTAIRAANEYPHKRLLVHYMQPHIPYIGETGSEVYPDGHDGGFARINTDEAEEWLIWDEVRSGNVSVDTLRQMYTENLQIVLESVRRLLTQIDGKSVISADHGEFLGDRPHILWPFEMFGHGNGRRYPRCERLCKVPWLVIDDSSRRQIVSEEPASDSESMDRDAVEERLRGLGYL